MACSRRTRDMISRSFTDVRGSCSLLVQAGFSHVHEDAADAVSIAVGALDEHDGNELVVGIDPALGAEGAAVAVAADRMAVQFAQGLGDYFPGQAVIGTAHPTHGAN